MNVEKKYVTVLKYLSVAIVLIIVLVPLYLVLAASLKGGEEFATSFKMALPENLFNFENYVTVFEKGRLATGFMNTAVIMIVAIIGNVCWGPWRPMLWVASSLRARLLSLRPIP